MNIREFDDKVIEVLHRHAEPMHRILMGLLFLWFGALKPLGHDTASSIIAHTIYVGDPKTMVPFLGVWEIAIGICLLWERLLRVGIALLALRVPGILLAFVLKAEVCFVHFPFTPTPEGQYLIKDLTIFVAALAIAGTLEKSGHGERQHEMTAENLNSDDNEG